MWFEDEASFYRHPTPARAWAARGPRQPLAKGHPASNTPWRVAASLDPVAGRLTHRFHRRVDAPAIGRFYQQMTVAAGPAERIYLVMDNLPLHHHQHALTAVAGDPRVVILWLPTYAPWLNPTEKVWKWVRQRFAHMHEAAADFAYFGRRLRETLNLAAADPAALLRYTGTGKCKLYS